MSGRLRLSPMLAAVALVAVACGGSSDQPVPEQAIVARPYVPPPDPVGFEIRRVPDPNAPAAPVASGSAKAAPASGGGSASAPRPKTSGGSAPAAPAAPAPTPGFVQGPGPKAPSLGTYSVKRVGTRTDEGSAPRSTDGTGTLNVTWLGGSTLKHDERIADSKTELTYRYDAAGIWLERLRRESSSGAFEQSFNPAQHVLRWPLTVGDTWKATWTNGTVSGTTTFTVVKQESVAAAGRSWPSFVIDTATATSGLIESNVNVRLWYVPELGVEVRRASESEGSTFGRRYTSSSVWEITALP